MNLILEINSKTACDISRDKLEMAIVRSIEKSGYDFLLDKDVEISIGFVDEKEIEKLNTEWRGVENATDILSFANYEGKKTLEKELNKAVFLGELIVCCDDIKKYAKIESSSFLRELVYVISHGTLHLLGFSHGDEMFLIQKEVTDEVLSFDAK